MNRLFLGMLLLLTSTSLLATAKYLGKSEEGLPIFTINLDAPPRERFQEPNRYFKEVGKTTLDKYLANLPPIALAAFYYLDWIPAMSNPEYFEELEGISEAMGLDRHVGVFMNYIYELLTFCTSSIAKLADGTIVHNRDLDFLFPDDMRKLIYIAEFMKNDTLLFRAVLAAGSNSVYTGIRNEAFSISEN